MITLVVGFFLLLTFSATMSPHAAIYKQEKSKAEKVPLLWCALTQCSKKECIPQKIKNCHSDNGAKKKKETVYLPERMLLFSIHREVFSSNINAWALTKVDGSCGKKRLTDTKKEKEMHKIKEITSLLLRSPSYFGTALVSLFFICYKKPVSSLVVVCSHTSQTTQELKRHSTQPDSQAQRVL